MKKLREIRTGSVIRLKDKIKTYNEYEIIRYYRIIHKETKGSTVVYRGINTVYIKNICEKDQLKLTESNKRNLYVVELNKRLILNVLKTTSIHINKCLYDEIVHRLEQVGYTTKSHMNIYVPMNKQIEKNKKDIIKNDKTAHILMLYNLDTENNKTYRVYVHYDDVKFICKSNITEGYKYYMKLIGARFAQQEIIASNQCD